MSSRENKKFERSAMGLLDAILAEMEDLRDGHSTPHEAIAFSSLADKALGVLDRQLRKEEVDNENEWKHIEYTRRIEMQKQEQQALPKPNAEEEIDEDADEYDYEYPNILDIEVVEASIVGLGE